MFYGEDVDEEWFHYRITADNTKPKRQPAFPSARFYSNGTAAGAFGTLCTIEEALIIMETANTLLIVLFGFSGAVALLIGYQIRQGQASEAISLPNLSLDKIKDRAGFSRFIGSRVMVIGLLGMLTAASIGLIPAVTQFVLLVFTLGTATISLQAVLAHKRYL